MFLGKADNRVKPSPPEGGNGLFTVSSGNEGGTSGTRRPPAPTTVGGKPAAKSHRVSRGVKAIKGFFARPVRDHNIAVIRDIEQTTAEIWLTFAFTVLVGSFFLGGGIYLIWLGSKNNVVDFVVVGGVGTLMGICFTSVGMFLFCKPLCRAHRKRKEVRQQEQEQAAQDSEYITRAKARLLTLQLADSMTNRRPSHSELYGYEEENNPPKGGKPNSRIQSPSSTATTYDPPPPIALPSKSKVGTQEGLTSPVILLRESTADDCDAIIMAAERRNLSKRGLITTHAQGHDDSKAETNVSSNDPDVEQTEEVAPTESGAANTEISDHRINQLDSDFRPQELGSSADLLADLADPSENNPGEDSQHNEIVSQRTGASSPGTTTVIAHGLEAGEEDLVSIQRRKSVLSAANDRRKSSAVVLDNDEKDEEDTIVVVPG